MLFLHADSSHGLVSTHHVSCSNKSFKTLNMCLLYVFILCDSQSNVAHLDGTSKELSLFFTVVLKKSAVIAGVEPKSSALISREPCIKQIIFHAVDALELKALNYLSGSMQWWRWCNVLCKNLLL